MLTTNIHNDTVISGNLVKKYFFLVQKAQIRNLENKINKFELKLNVKILKKIQKKGKNSEIKQQEFENQKNLSIIKEFSVQTES